MSKKIAIPDASFCIDECATFIQDKYKGRGYDVQRTIVEGQNALGIHVKIDAASSTLGRILRFVTGLSSRVTLKLTASDENLDVEIAGGMWVDKLFAAVICWFCLWPLLVTMLIGVFRQMALHDKVYGETLRWIAEAKKQPFPTGTPTSSHAWR